MSRRVMIIDSMHSEVLGVSDPDYRHQYFRLHAVSGHGSTPSAALSPEG